MLFPELAQPKQNIWIQVDNLIRTHNHLDLFTATPDVHELRYVEGACKEKADNGVWFWEDCTLLGSKVMGVRVVFLLQRNLTFEFV